MSTLSTTTNISTTLDGFTLSGAKTDSETLTGSNGAGASVEISASVWTAIDISGLSDVRMIWAYNASSSFPNPAEFPTSNGVITLASDLAGANRIAHLQQNDSALIPWSGSLAALYASANSGSISTLQYIVVER